MQEDTRFRFLFVSSRCSLRSVLAVSCMHFVAAHRFSAFACGQPGRVASEVHPAAFEALQLAGMDAPAVAPIAWDAFRRMGAPRIDFVISLDAHLESPAWPGQPETAVWNYPDLLASDSAEPLVHRATTTLHSLRRRFEILANLPMRAASRQDLRHDLRDLAYGD